MLRLLVVLAVASVALAAPKERLVKKTVVPDYQVIRGYMNWYEARDACKAIPGGYRLVEIRSAAENDIIRTYKDAGVLWVGITDLDHEGTFTYYSYDEALVYSNWGGGEPNDYGGEDCTNIRSSDGTWNDLKCTSYFGDAMCEHYHSYIAYEPHMSTFDGHAYTYQGICWLTMFKDCTENHGFEVTTKFESREDSTADEIRTRIASFNVTVGDQYVIVDGRDIATGRTGGELTAAKAIDVEEKDKTIVLRFTSKDTTFTLEWTLRRHVLSVSFTGSHYHGKLCGLMGNADGNPHNDFQKPDGSVVNDVVEFGESWKVKEKECE